MFKNSALDINSADVASLDTLEMNGLMPKYKWVIVFNYCITLLIFNGLIFGFFQLEDEILLQNQLYIYAIVNALIFALLIITIITFKYRKFALRDHDIIYESGWLIYYQGVVPFNRLQYVNINQGLLMRALGLGTIVLHTAGSEKSAMKISGLEINVAMKIKAIVAEKMNATLTTEDVLENVLKPEDTDGL